MTSQVGTLTDDLQDLNELVQACSFSTTSFNPSGTQTSAQTTGDASVTTPAGSDTVTQGPTQTSQSAAEQTSNAAQVLDVQGFRAVIGLGAAVLLGAV
jgi:hypothetical protein